MPVCRQAAVIGGCPAAENTRDGLGGIDMRSGTAVVTDLGARRLTGSRISPESCLAPAALNEMGSARIGLRSAICDLLPVPARLHRFVEIAGG